MKKLLLTVITLISVSALFAQEGVTSFGFTLGFTEPCEFYRASSVDTKLTRSATDGVKVGFIYETNIIKGFGVSMGLNYGFGAKVGQYQITSGMGALQHKEDHFFHFLELPVDWQYKFLIAKHTYLGLYTGPTLQIGLSNKYRNRTRLNGTIIDDVVTDVYKMDTDNDNIPDYHRVNVTWGVGAMFQYKRYFIRGGYDFGVMPLYKDGFHNVSSESGWNRKGRLDQWQIKLGIYLWQVD